MAAAAASPRGGAPDGRNALHLLKTNTGHYIYVDYSHTRNSAFLRALRPSPFRVFIGPRGEMAKAKVKSVTLYRDGGTMVIETNRGRLYVPAEYKGSTPTWDGSPLERLALDDGAIDELGVYEKR